MKKMKQTLLCALLAITVLLAGCGKRQAETPEKIRDLELTVVAEEKLPEELLAAITEKKAAPFKFTFQDSGYLYICIGYGEQESGGYSITVEDLYLTENAIYVKTCLIGPGADVPDDGVKSYPYIVIKTEYLDYSVVFD
ncbi:MAG: protease complex subunit PrcB family protein [Lachnospiraceae bacterium]|nr:protease complex subunit PrcB family protein [Lachnospiraceae bacterium]